jgi:hypothetical protein
VDLTDVGGRFVGDFSRIYPRMTDVDPCFENETPVLMFVDDGSCPSNQANNGGSPPCQSTLGSTSFQHNYGVPGGWVNDFVGGLSLGFDSLDNEVWSPEIAWDRPGTDDDAPEVAGAFLRYSVWRHLPYDNGQFYTWRVRSSPDDRVTWTPWRNRGVDYYGGGTGEWVNAQHDISDMLVPGATHVQVALGVRDLAGPLGLPGTDATPSPAFDNVGVFKYRVGGPKITAREDDLFNDSFPQSGEADFHTLVGRQNSDCRLDMARDVGAGASIVPGDSIVVDVVPVIPGTTLTQVRLNWVLDLNPKFDDVRVQPPGTNVIPNGAANAWDQWTGSVNGVAHCPNRFSFDLPDADFMHPGDQLRYYVEATDSDGRTTTMPGSVDGFDTGRTVSSGLYASMFTVNALPSIVDDGAGGWAQPRILLINDFGLRGGQAEYFQTFEQNGWRRGIEWDLYTTLAPSSFLSNGIGSTGAHGANAEQLRGYDVIIYVAGDLSWDLLSDGSNAGGNDKGDDIGVLTAWLNQDADRYIAHFGDDVVSGLIQSSPGTGGTYASTIMGVILNDDDVRDMIGGQRSPRVVPDIGSPCFTLDYAASGIRKVDRNTYDDISPGAGAVISHRFLDPSGLPYAGVGQAASVTSAFTDGQGNQKISITFPYDLSFVDNEVDQPGGPLSERAKLLREIIEDCFGKAVGGGGPPVGIPERLSFRGSRNLQSHPNPFNPATKISFEVGHRTHASVHIYNLRGERVATLLNETIDSGPKEVIWRGVDDSGTAVASGTYFARVVVDGMTEVVKLALLK